MASESHSQRTMPPLVLWMSNVDVRLSYLSFEILEGQDVADFGFVVADCRLERAGSSCGDDCCRLLEPVEDFLDFPTPCSVNARPVPATTKAAVVTIVNLFILHLDPETVNDTQL